MKRLGAKMRKRREEEWRKMKIKGKAKAVTRWKVRRGGTET